MINFGHLARRRVAGWLLLAALWATVGTALRGQADGSKKWGPYSVGGYIVSSPAIAADGTIYVGVRINTNPGRGLLLAVPPNGGVPKWQFNAPDWVESSPAVGADGTVYFGCDNGVFFALNPATGAVRWQFDTKVSIYSSPAIARDGTIYVGGTDSALHAFSPSGTEVWKLEVGDWIDSSPAVAADGTIYFGSWDKRIYAANPNGTIKWSVLTGAEVLSSPAIGADGTVYCGSSDGRLYAIAPDGRVLWSFRTEGAVLSSPVLAPDGTVYVGSNDFKFYAINPNGTSKWTAGYGRQIVSTAAVRADGTVIFGADDKVVRALNPADGTIKWAFAMQDIVESSPAIGADGTIYVAQLDGALYALNGNGSPLSSYSSWPMRGHDPYHTGAKSASTGSGQLLNLATRGPVGGASNLFAGMVVAGESPKRFLFRGIGPTLAQFPAVPNPLPDPVMRLVRFSDNALINQSDNWGTAGDESELRETAASVGAFPLPTGSKDAALVTALAPGLYTTVIQSADGTTGTALVEAYDASPASSAARLVNLSTRGRVTGGGSVIPGLYIGGNGPLRVLMRAVGPTLGSFGVDGALARPTMSLFSEQTLLRSNTGWTTGGLKADLAAAMSAVGAFPLPDSSTDCAMLVTLNPGAYTIPVAGINNTSGEVLIEVYVVP